MQLVEQTPPGLVTPIVAAQRLRLTGLIGAARGDEPAAVESVLVDAIEALASYGEVPDRARTEADLARWLIDQGRADEAEPWLASAAETMTELGATAWLAELPVASTAPLR